MRNRLFLSLFIGASMLFVGCAARSGTGTGNGSADGSGNTFSDQSLSLEEGARWPDDGGIPTAREGSAFPDVFFDYDSALVPDQFHDPLRRSAEVLQSDGSLRVDVEGHCDRRGTSEYNLALGEERANAVAKLLVNFGARASQLSIISYGEEIPLDPRDADDAYAKNRRAHLAVFRNNKR